MTVEELEDLFRRLDKAMKIADWSTAVECLERILSEADEDVLEAYHEFMRIKRSIH